MQSSFLIVALLFAGAFFLVSNGRAQTDDEKQGLEGLITGSLDGKKTPAAQTPLPPIPESDHQSIEAFLAAMRADPEKERVSEALVRYGRWRERIRTEIIRQGAPEDLLALVFVESAYKPKALSRSDAAGFWQILPPTARLHRMRRDAFIDERYDPEAATRFACDYLRGLYGQFGDWYLAMAAYNLGKGDLSRILEKGAPKDFFAMRNKGLLRKETADYVPRILAARRLLHDPEKYGFPRVKEEEGKMVGLILRPLTDTQRLELLAGVPGGTIRALNPALRTDYAPPDPGGYHIFIPETYREALDRENLKQNAVADWDGLRRMHRTTVVFDKKTTLYSVGKIYDTCVESLRLWNNLGPEEVPAPGDKIVVYVPDDLKTP